MIRQTGDCSVGQTGQVIIWRPVATYALVVTAQFAGLWLVWRAVPEDRDWLWIAVGLAALAGYVVVAARSSDVSFVRVVAVYGVLFAGTCLAWGVAAHGERPDVFDAAGTMLCLAGAGSLAMLAPLD